MSTKRYVTTWTSEDSIAWKLYIIPSDADYITGGSCTDITLPSDFLLRDMTLDTELGAIPSGVVSQVLKINVNIASLQNNTDLNNLRAQLLKGTTTKKEPLKSDGSNFLTSAELTTEEKQFDCFNTFILQYNDGSGYKVAFIGCQKYSAENELEITALDNVVKFGIEIFDIFRCIGEIISPKIWCSALACNSDNVIYSSVLTQPENTSVPWYYIGNYLYETNITAFDVLRGDYEAYVSTFDRLKTKISTMYTAYMRAILSKLNCSFTSNQFFCNTEIFKNWSGYNIAPEKLCYIAEIWEIKDKQRKLVGGAHYDNTLFEQFTNFFEVYKMILEGSLEIARPSYSFTAGTPDSYSVTMIASNPYPILPTPNIQFDQTSTYGSLKVKMFSEALNQVKVAVTSIKGNNDTDSFEYGKQGTSGDNSKDLKIMFHNVPIISNRTVRPDIEYDGKSTYSRTTVNAGTIYYYDTDLKLIPRRVNTNLQIFFGGEDFGLSYTTPPYLKRPEYQMLLEQQESGLPTTIAQAMVNFLGRSKQAEGTLTTTFTIAQFNDVGTRVLVDLEDYNSLLSDIYDTGQVLAVLTAHSHKIYEGMADITIRIDAESE